MVKSQASTGRPVTEDSITDIGLEATKEYIILSAASTSLREKVNERVRARLNRDPGDEVEEIDKHSLIWGIFMTSSMYAAIFLGKDYSENLRSVTNPDQKPTVQKLFDVTQKLIREQTLEISGVSELNLGKFYMGEADPAERRRGDQAHEGKSKPILRLSIARWKDARVSIL